MKTKNQGAAVENMADHLEALINKQGIQCVLSALEGICYGKAEHLRENWQSRDVVGPSSPKAWETAAKYIGRAWTQCGNVGL